MRSNVRKYTGLFLLLILSGCGKSIISPVTNESNVTRFPTDSVFEPNPQSEELPFVTGIALISNNRLYIRCRTYMPETSFTYQIYVNNDGDNSTGFHGYDYLLQGPTIEPSLVVRPLYSSGERGPVSGAYSAVYVASRRWLSIVVPLCSMPGTHKPNTLELLMYSAATGHTYQGVMQIQEYIPL